MRGCLRRLPAFSVVAEDFGTAGCLPVQCDIELLLGNVDAKPGGNSHFHVLADVRERSRAVPAVRQPCTQGQVRSAPRYLISRAWGSRAEISVSGFDAKAITGLPTPLPQVGYDAPACKTNVQGDDVGSDRRGFLRGR